MTHFKVKTEENRTTFEEFEPFEKFQARMHGKEEFDQQVRNAAEAFARALREEERKRRLAEEERIRFQKSQYYQYFRQHHSEHQRNNQRAASSTTTHQRGNITSDQLTMIFRRLAKKYHPDTGGSTQAMQAINEMLSEIKKIIGQ